MKNIFNKYKISILYFVYWLIFSIPILLIKVTPIHLLLILLAAGCYLPYTMFIKQKQNHKVYENMTKNQVIKSESKNVIVSFLLFTGVLLCANAVLIPEIEEIKQDFHNLSIKMSSEKVLELENLSIYINEDKNKSYSFYKMNGKHSKEYLDEDNLIELSKSEMSERYSNFYKIDDVEVAFATHKNQLVTEALFNISFNDKQYLIKSYLPQENTLSLLTKTGFKEALNISFNDGSIKNIYINQESKEIAISDNNIIVVEKYVEAPYNKNDYFSFRYDIFNNYAKDNTMIQPNLEVSLLSTHGEISNDIQRMSFYLETNEEGSNNYSEVIEIIFAEVAYIFRTGIIDALNITSINRAK